MQRATRSGWLASALLMVASSWTAFGEAVRSPSKPAKAAKQKATTNKKQQAEIDAWNAAVDERKAAKAAKKGGL